MAATAGRAEAATAGRAVAVGNSSAAGARESEPDCRTGVKLCTTLAAPDTAQYPPRGQLLQAVALKVAEYEPMGQMWQLSAVSAASALYVPGMHLRRGEG